MLERLITPSVCSHMSAYSVRATAPYFTPSPTNAPLERQAAAARHSASSARRNVGDEGERKRPRRGRQTRKSTCLACRPSRMSTSARRRSSTQMNSGTEPSKPSEWPCEISFRPPFVKKKQIKSLPTAICRDLEDEPRYAFMLGPQSAPLNVPSDKATSNALHDKPSSAPMAPALASAPAPGPALDSAAAAAVWPLRPSGSRRAERSARCRFSARLI